jgi:DNA repair protein RadC
LIDNKDGNIKWNEIFNGNAKKTKFHLKEVIEMALDNLMSNISNSTSFKKAIERSE